MSNQTVVDFISQAATRPINGQRLIALAAIAQREGRMQEAERLIELAYARFDEEEMD
jgi:hypothetical protein